MSHFTVLVIGDNIEKQLQPYHEYECTGIDDEYVIDVDKTEEVESWLKEFIWFGKTKNGGVWDYEYKEEGAIENLVDIKLDTRRSYFNNSGLDIDKEIEEWHGYTKRGNQWIRHTNPNDKWDWWVVGGRWTGFFKLKQGAVGETGKPGLMTPIAMPGYCDSALKRDIDFDSMRMTKRLEAEKEWHSVNDVIAKSEGFRTWEEITEGKNYGDEQRAAYRSQPEVQHFNNIKRGVWDKVEDYFIPKEDYVTKAVNSAGVTFAVVKDGQWYEKGKMGWWGLVSDDKGQDEWNRKFQALIDSVPDDTLLTVVDCHI
jgi:hypothetical protein